MYQSNSRDCAQGDKTPQPRYVLWLRTARDGWTAHFRAPTRDECWGAMDPNDWPDHALTVAYVVLGVGQRPGPDTAPDVTIYLREGVMRECHPPASPRPPRWRARLRSRAAQRALPGPRRPAGGDQRR
jgi:hypothetical protein